MRLDWVNPAALAGLVAIVGPVLVHLLLRQRAPRVPFPTVRFLAPARAAAARIRKPSDLLLLYLRIAVVSAAAIAAAQPVLMTSWRRAAWEQRVARVLVVDDTDSVGAAALRIRDAIAAERKGATEIFEVHATNLSDGLKQALTMLRPSDAGRAEIVLISDFKIGSVSRADANALPAGIGLRFIAMNPPQTAASFSGLRLFQAGNGPTVQQQITLDGPQTRVRLVASRSAVASVSAARHVKILVPSDQAKDVESLERILSAAGAPALPADRGLTMIFSGVRLPEVQHLRVGWMVNAFAVAGTDERLRSAASTHPGALHQRLPAQWAPLTWNGSGQPVVLVAAANQDLVAYVAAAPTELVAAAALRALLSAIAPLPSWPEKEVERLSPSQLTEWTREAKPSIERWRSRAPGDARWLWGLAVGLLLIEGFVRRSRLEAREEQARAA